MLTPRATLTDTVAGPDGRPTPWFEPRYAVDLSLVTGRVDVDTIGPLASTVRDLVRYPLGAERAETQVARTVSASTGLPVIADEVAVGTAQAAVTVPLLMAQIALLIGCVLWLVLVAAADQRRAEVAVARLRGRGRAAPVGCSSARRCHQSSSAPLSGPCSRSWAPLSRGTRCSPATLRTRCRSGPSSPSARHWSS